MKKIKLNKQPLIFQSDIDNDVFIGESPIFESDKMNPDCLRCEYCWSNFEDIYCCELPNVQCDFECIY